MSEPRWKSALRSLLHLGLPMAGCLAVLVWLRHSGLGVDGVGPQSTTIAVGFLLIGAFVGGQLAARLGLPRISGYLLVGLAAGPHVSGLITKDMLVAGKALNGIAVALIALTAGGEIKVDWVRKQIRRLTLITGSQLVVGLLGSTLVVMLGRSFMPFMPQGSFIEGLAVAFVFGAIAVASSPTVTIAVIAETQADGPMSRTVIGVTILKDVCVIVLFAIALAVARDVLGDGGGESLVWSLTRELGGSVLAGVGVGVGVSWFLEKINRDVPVFTLAVCFGVSQAASALHLEALLIALTAGFYVENFAKVDGHRLIAGVERVSLPVFALFFALAGAKVDVSKLVEFAPIATVLILSRAGLIYLGTRVGTHLAQVEPVVKRLAWTGFISQAGVTLALSAIVARSFPKWGADAEVLIIAMIAVHEIVGPILFHYGLKRSGEVGMAGKAERAEGGGGTEVGGAAEGAHTGPPGAEPAA